MFALLNMVIVPDAKTNQTHERYVCLRLGWSFNHQFRNAGHVDSGGRAIQHLHLGYQCWIPVERSTQWPILSFKCNFRVFDCARFD